MEKKEGGGKKKKVTVIYQSLHSKQLKAFLQLHPDHKLFLLQCNCTLGYIEDSLHFWQF